MSNRIPITMAHQLNDIDDTECMQGYWDGKDNEPPPGDNRSYSYWHGYRNGQADGGHKPIDAAQRALAKDVVEKRRESESPAGGK